LAFPYSKAAAEKPKGSFATFADLPTRQQQGGCRGGPLERMNDLAGSGRTFIKSGNYVFGAA